MAVIRPFESLEVRPQGAIRSVSLSRFISCPLPYSPDFTHVSIPLVASKCTKTHAGEWELPDCSTLIFLSSLAVAEHCSSSQKALMHMSEGARFLRRIGSCTSQTQPPLWEQKVKFTLTNECHLYQGPRSCIRVFVQHLAQGAATLAGSLSTLAYQ